MDGVMANYVEQEGTNSRLGFDARLTEGWQRLLKRTVCPTKAGRPVTRSPFSAQGQDPGLTDIAQYNTLYS